MHSTDQLVVRFNALALAPATDLYSPAGKGWVISDFQLARHGKRGPARSSLPVVDVTEFTRWRSQLVFFDGHTEAKALDRLKQLSWHVQRLRQQVKI